MNSVNIIPVSSAEQIDVARELFREYAASLGFALCFQGFERELAELPGEYSAPNGRLLVAYCGQRPAGCVALRPIGGGISEMKRLYTRPDLRGKGIGQSLALAIIEAARALGYTSIRLDTVPAMTHAIALYRSLGFREIAPYRRNPIPGALYMELAPGNTL